MKVSKNVKDIIAYKVERIFIEEINKCDLQIAEEREILKKQMEDFKKALKNAENSILTGMISNFGKQYSDLEYDDYSLIKLSFKEDAKELVEYLGYNIHYSKWFSVDRVSSKKLRDLAEKKKKLLEAQTTKTNDIVLKIELEARTKDDVQQILDSIKVEE